LVEEEVDEKAREIILKQVLIDFESECKEGEDEEEMRKNLMKVEGYSKVEIEEDMNTIDWDIAYQEVIKLEEEKNQEKEK